MSARKKRNRILSSGPDTTSDSPVAPSSDTGDGTRNDFSLNRQLYPSNNNTGGNSDGIPSRETRKRKETPSSKTSAAKKKLAKLSQ